MACRARRGAAADAGFSLERLETRQLLAITVTDQNLASFKLGADYIFSDPTSITVAPGLVINEKLVSSGRIPAPATIAEWIKASG